MSTFVLDRRVPRAFVEDGEGQLSLDGFGLVTTDPRRAGAAPPAAAPRPLAAVPAGAAGRTLDDLLSGVWRELVEGRDAPCPVCAAQMSCSGHCSGCGSQLS